MIEPTDRIGIRSRTNLSFEYHNPGEFITNTDGLDHNSGQCWQCYRLPRWETLARRASEENADRIPGAASVRTRLAAFRNLVGQRPLSSLARRASVKVASLSTLDLAGVMIKANTDR